MDLTLQEIRVVQHILAPIPSKVARNVYMKLENERRKRKHEEDLMHAGASKSWYGFKSKVMEWVTPSTKRRLATNGES